MAVKMTVSSTPIIGQIAWLLGWLMTGIFWIISQMGIPNVGLSIIIFTVIILMAMMPLQIKQQRFSKLSNIMQPEIQKIQKRYKGKKDQVSQQKQMDEINAVYAKYGVSQMGSCIQLLIQMPILFGLYQVIYKIPGYIRPIYNHISVIATNSAFKADFAKFVTDTANSTLTKNYSTGSTKHIIDAVYGLSTSQWDALMKTASGTSYEAALRSVHTYVHRATYFVGLNISDSPWQIIKTAVTEKQGMWILMLIAAVMIPFLAWLTQWLNTKLMPQPQKAEGNDTAAQMQNSMQSMNLVMPLMSAFFCLTLPVGVGIYWFMSAGVRCIQQVFINRRLDQETEEDIIRQAQEKADRKRAKKGLPPQQIAEAAHISTKSIERTEPQAVRPSGRKNMKSKQLEEGSMESYSTKEARPGSLASKANMVKTFDEKHGGRNDDDVYRRYKK